MTKGDLCTVPARKPFDPRMVLAISKILTLEGRCAGALPAVNYYSGGPEITGPNVRSLFSAKAAGCSVNDVPFQRTEYDSAN